MDVQGKKGGWQSFLAGDLGASSWLSLNIQREVTEVTRGTHYFPVSLSRASTLLFCHVLLTQGTPKLHFPGTLTASLLHDKDQRGKSAFLYCYHMHTFLQ